MKRHKQFVLDGEAVILGVDGISDFNALQAASPQPRSAKSWGMLGPTKITFAEISDMGVACTAC